MDDEDSGMTPAQRGLVGVLFAGTGATLLLFGTDYLGVIFAAGLLIVGGGALLSAVRERRSGRRG